MQVLNVLGYLCQLRYFESIQVYIFMDFKGFSEHNNVNIPFTQAVPNSWKHNYC